MPKRNHNDNTGGDDGSMCGDDSSSVSSQSQNRKRRKYVASPLEICQDIYDRLRYYKNEEGRLLCEAFIRVPNRRAAAEYYEVVKTPIDLIRIQNKIKSEEYVEVQQFQTDIELLVSNAKAFYAEDSQEHKDAGDLMELFLSERAAIEALNANGGEPQSSSYNRSRRSGPRKEDKEDDESDQASLITPEPPEMSTDAHLEYLFATVVSTPSEDGRNWADAFKILPSKQVYPQYYETIKEPIDLRMIAQKIHTGQYCSLDDLEKDFNLLTKNARQFNEPKSSIYQDAVFVNKIVKNKRGELDQLKGFKTSERIRTFLSSKRSIDHRDVVENFACIEVLPDKPPEEEEEEEEEEEMEEEVEGSAIEEEPQEIEFEPIDHRSMPLQLFHFVVNYKNPHGQTICDPFLKLPSRKQYPDYYVEIKNPLSLSNIKTKLKRNHYKSLDQLANDLDLVFNNAQQYNIEESKIYKDAVKLQKCMRAKKDEFQRLENQLKSRPWTGLDVNPVPVVSRPAPPQASSCVGMFLTAMPMSCNTKVIPVAQLDTDSAGDDRSRSTFTPLMPLGAGSSSKPETPQPTMNESQGDAQQVTMITGQPRNNNGGMMQPMSIPLTIPIAGPGVPENVPMTSQSSVVSALSDAIRKRAAAGGRRPLPPDEIRKKRITALYQAIHNYEEDGRLLRDIFMVVPSKQDYPDYYRVIPEPIDLSTIKKKIDSEVYNSHHELVADLRLMFNNARHYNEENSQVYRDAESLEKLLKKKLKNLGSLSGIPRQPKRKTYPPLRGLPGSVAGMITPAPLQRRLQELFLTIRDYRDTSGRSLAVPFLRLPSRTDLPQYYEFIKKPIELETICTKIGSGKYQTLEDLVMDLVLMFDNACKFNEPDSAIYRDALTLMRVCMDKRAAMLATAGPEEQEDKIPDVRAAVQDIMSGIVTHLYYFRDDDGRQLTDSFVELAQQQQQQQEIEEKVKHEDAAEKEEEVQEKKNFPLTLDQVKTNVEARRYRRLDRLQDDVLEVFTNVRKVSRSDSQAFEDSCTLHRMYLAIRDQLCRRGEVLQSPSLRQTELQLEEELRRYAARKEDGSEASDQNQQQDLAPSKAVEITADGKASKPIFRDGQTYDVGDFIYVAPATSDTKDPHICCIEDIRCVEGEAQPFINWYYRPVETFHVQTRKFMEQEVFKSDSFQYIKVSDILRRCHVMYVKEYIKQKPLVVSPGSDVVSYQGMDDKDVYVCESRYSTKHKAFKKIKIWPVKLSPRIKLMDRESICLPARVPSDFAAAAGAGAESSIKQEKLEPSSSQPLPLLEKTKVCVVTEDRSNSEGVIYYEQYIYDNGFWVKIGDYVYVPSMDGQGRHIVRIDRMWKNTVQNVLYFSGPWFVAPVEIEHLPTRVFYSKEVFLSSVDHASHLLSSILGKCHVLALQDYAAYRPTEYNEDDIYLCESKYFVDEKAIRRLKKGLKKFQLSEASLEDEMYIFRKQINPKKEASPLLYQASQEPLCYDLIRNSHQGAGALQSSFYSGDDDTRDSFPGSISFDDGSQHATPQASVLEQRGSKRKKLRKAPSGYVVFAGEVRKDLLRQRPEAAFGEISKEVGLMWRNLAQTEKDRYEKRAQEIKKAMEEEEAARNLAAQLLQESMPPPPPHQPSPAPSPAPIPLTGSPVRVSTPMNNHGLVQVIQSSQNAISSTQGHNVGQSAPQLVYLPNGQANGQPQLVQAIRQTGTPQTGQQTTQQATQPVVRPPSPVFVSCPPRTTRVMHSEIYQKYMERVRRNADYLSDWPKQLNATAENTPLTVPAAAKLHQIGSTFLTKIPEKQEEISSALWSLRDHLLRDALNIQLRELPLEEL